MTDTTITLNGVEYIRMDSVKTVSDISGSAFVIVRCRNAGVHAGNFISRDGNVLVLGNSRRLWRWWSKATLSELAMEGPVKINENRYGCVLPSITLTASDVCEVIYCTFEAAKKILAVPVWEAAR